MLESLRTNVESRYTDTAPGLTTTKSEARQLAWRLWTVARHYTRLIGPGHRAAFATRTLPHRLEPTADRRPAASGGGRPRAGATPSGRDDVAARPAARRSRRLLAVRSRWPGRYEEPDQSVKQAALRRLLPEAVRQLAHGLGVPPAAEVELPEHGLYAAWLSLAAVELWISHRPAFRMNS